MSNEAEDKVPALTRALDVIDRIAFTTAGMSYKEILDSTGIPAASLTRILGLLSAKGYLSRAQDGKYRLGIRLYAIGAIAGQQIDLLAIAEPVLGRLRDATQETVELAVPEGREITVVGKAESERSVRLFAQIGYRLKRLHVSGLGKAALAHVDEKALAQYVAQADWSPTTATTITDPAALAKDLDAIRERGYAYDDREVREDVRRVAAPAFDAAGRLAAIVGIAAPEFRLPMIRIDLFGKMVKAAAGEISVMLGRRVREEAPAAAKA